MNKKKKPKQDAIQSILINITPFDLWLTFQLYANMSNERCVIISELVKKHVIEMKYRTLFMCIRYTGAYPCRTLIYQQANPCSDIFFSFIAQITFRSI